MAEVAEVPKTPWACDEQDYYKLHGVSGSSSTFTSPRGLCLFTRTWLPLSSPPSACICMIHGYTNDISWTFQNTAVRFASSGFAAFAMDMEGHGLSPGLKGFVPDFDLVTQDFLAFFESKKREPDFLGLPFFLFGESLGGGVCLLVHFLAPDAFDGAILVAPMCKISDSVHPPWPLPQMLNFFSLIAPTWGVVPTKEIRDLSFKDPVKLDLSKRNPRKYIGKPRLGTAREFMRVTSYLSERLQDVSLPFIVLHGGRDVVTDPASSKTLYEKAISTDKTLKIYEDMLHALLAGEYDEDVAVIFSDIKTWLVERVERKLPDKANENPHEA